MLKSSSIDNDDVDGVVHGDTVLIQQKDSRRETFYDDHYKVYGNIKVLHTVNFKSDALCCRFSQDGTKIAIGLASGDVKVCKAANGEMIYHLPSPLSANVKDVIKEPSVAVTSLHFVPPEASSRGEVLIVTHSGGMVKVWHISTGQVLSTIQENRQTLASAISRTFQQLITAGTSDELFQYDLETNQVVKTYAPRYNKTVMDGHRFRVLSIKFHPTFHNNFVSGGWDDTLQIWDSRQSHSVRHIYGPHICGGDAIDIDPIYNHILTSSWRSNDVLQIWDFQTGEKIQNFRNDYHGNSMLYCGQWLGTQHVVCGGSDRNMIKISNKTTLETTGIITEMETGVYSIDFDRANIKSDDVTTLAAACGSRLHIISNAPQQAT